MFFLRFSSCSPLPKKNFFSRMADTIEVKFKLKLHRAWMHLRRDLTFCPLTVIQARYWMNMSCDLTKA